MRTYLPWFEQFFEEALQKAFPGGSEGKASACNAEDLGSILGSRRSLEERNDNPLMFLPGESHGQKILVGYSPQGHKESDTTETTQHAFICLQLFLLLIAISYILVISPIPAFCPGKTKYSVKIFITVKVDPLTFPKGNISRNH